MEKQSRKNLIIDRKIQFMVAKRVVIYWASSFMFVALTLTFWKTFVSDGGLFLNNFIGSFVDYGPVFLVMLFFLPFAVFDSIRLTHRLVGPIYRLRSDLESFKNNNNVRTKIRETDFFQELPIAINEVLNQIQTLQSNETEEPVDQEVLV